MKIQRKFIIDDEVYHYEIDTRVVGALEKCTTKDEVEEVFHLFQSLIDKQAPEEYMSRRRYQTFAMLEVIKPKDGYITLETRDWPSRYNAVLAILISQVFKPREVKVEVHVKDNGHGRDGGIIPELNPIQKRAMDIAQEDFKREVESMGFTNVDYSVSFSDRIRNAMPQAQKEYEDCIAGKGDRNSPFNKALWEAAQASMALSEDPTCQTVELPKTSEFVHVEKISDSWFINLMTGKISEKDIRIILNTAKKHFDADVKSSPMELPEHNLQWHIEDLIQKKIKATESRVSVHTLNKTVQMLEEEWTRRECLIRAYDDKVKHGLQPTQEEADAVVSQGIVLNEETNKGTFV